MQANLQDAKSKSHANSKQASFYWNLKCLLSDSKIYLQDTMRGIVKIQIPIFLFSTEILPKVKLTASLSYFNIRFG